MLRKSWWIGLCIFTVLFVGIRPVGRWVFRWQVVKNIEQTLGGAAVVSSVGYEDDFLVLHDVKVTGTGWIRTLDVVQVRVKYPGGIWPSGFDEVVLRNPVLALDLEYAARKPGIERVQVSSLLPGRIIAQEGVVDWWTGTQFEARGEWCGEWGVSEKGAHGNLEVQMDQSTLSLHTVMEEHLSIQASALNFPLPLVAGFLQQLEYVPTSIAVQEGRVNGQVKWQLPVAEKEDSYGQLVISDLHATALNSTSVDIPEMKIVLGSSPSNEVNETVVSLSGELQLTPLGACAPQSREVKGLRARFNLNQEGALSLSCRGQWWQGESVQAMRLDINGENFQAKQAKFALIGEDSPLLLSWERRTPAESLFDWRECGAPELTFALACMGDNVTVPSDLYFTEGRCSGSILYSPLHVEANLTATAPMRAQFISRGCVGGFADGTFQGTLRKNDIEEPWSLVYGALSFQEGQLERFTAEGTELISQSIEGHLVQKEDASLDIRLSGSLPNGCGTWMIDKKEEAHFTLLTKGGGCSFLFPNRYHDVLASIIQEDPIEVKGEISLLDQQLHFEGDVEVTSTENQGKDQLHLELLADVQGPWNEEVIKQFCFQTSELSLGRYLSPLFPSAIDAPLEGFGRFHGIYEEQQLTMQFDAQNVVMDLGRLRLKVPALALEPDNHPSLPGLFTYHFGNEELQLRIAVPEAEVQDLDTGLTVQKLFGILSMDEGGLFVDEMEGFINGLYLTGKIFAQGDWLNNKQLAWHATLSSMQGQLADLRHIIAVLDSEDSLIYRLPLEGSVALDDVGGGIDFSTGEGPTSVSVSLEGHVSDGQFTSAYHGAYLQEIQADFRYVYPKKVLDLSNIQGTVLVGTPQHIVEEYLFAGDQVSISDRLQKEVKFDIWVGDKNRDLIRLAGHAQSLVDHSSAVTVHFDNSRTHLGSLRPRLMELVLNDWSSIQRFFLDADIRLERFQEDLGQWSRTELLYEAQHVADWVHSLRTTAGQCSLQCSYHGANGLFSYQMSGDNIRLNDHLFHKFRTSGHIQGHTWVLDQFKLDDMSISADLFVKEQDWKINFLGVRIGSAMLAGIEGTLHPRARFVEGKVTLFEVSLDHLLQRVSLDQGGGKFLPEGQIRGNGNLRAQWCNSISNLQVQADLKLKAQGVGIHHMRLRTAHPISCHFSSERGFETEGFEAFLDDTTGRAAPVKLHMGHCGVNPMNELAISMAISHFEAPCTSYAFLMDSVAFFCDKSYQSHFRALTQRIRPSSLIQGSLLAENARRGVRVQLDLLPISLEVLHYPLQFEEMRVSYDLDGFCFNSKWVHRGESIWIAWQKQLADTSQILHTDTPEALTFTHDSEKVVINGLFTDVGGFQLNKAAGRLLGCSLDLEAREEFKADKQTLMGKVELELDKLTRFLPPSLAIRLEPWMLKGKCSLSGNWTLCETQKEWLVYQGKLQMDRLDVCGYVVEDLSAQATLAPGNFQIRSLSIRDPFLSLTAPSLSFQNSSYDRWHFSAGKIHIERFRPLELRSASTSPRHTSRDLAITDCTLHGVRGVLGDEKSYHGKGELAFTHSTRKKSASGFFGCTTDFFSTLGLDIDLLRPTSGKVLFELANGDVTLTGLKDVVSKGKVTRFSLPKDAPPSVIHSDGSLELSIRIKPNQPLLKLGDKLLLHISGNLRHPEYVIH